MEYVTLKQLIKDLKFKIVEGDFKISDKIQIKKRGITKGGLELTGVYHKNDKGKILIFGTNEMDYISRMKITDIKQVFNDIFSQQTPIVVFTKNQEVPKIVIKVATKYNSFILSSQFSYTDTAYQVAQYLSINISKKEQVHGTLMQIYGKGVLITGESGIGKSETAIELIKKGHLFVSDDATIVKRSGLNLYGTSADVIKNLLEVRGLGIIDVATLFGLPTIIETSKIDYIFNLKEYKKTTDFDRLGNNVQYKKIHGLKIPIIDIPISSARNTSTLVEVAVSQQIIKEKGHDSVKVIQERLGN